MTPKRRVPRRLPPGARELSEGSSDRTYDFGNAPILRTLPGGKRIIVIGQKSGIVWGLDPDADGQGLWHFKAGKGSALGGIEWGSAADETARTSRCPTC